MSGAACPEREAAKYECESDTFLLAYGCKL